MPLLRTSPTIVPAVAAAIAVAAVAPASASAFSLSDLFPAKTTTAVTQAAASGGAAAATAASTAANIAQGAAGAVTAVATSTAPTSCPTQTVRQAFSAYGDKADYALAPGGDFESTAGWTLAGGAKIVSGNESAGVQGGSKSLSLPLGATATSPQFCVDASNPYFRFVSKPDNAVAGYAAIVIYRTSAGKIANAQFTSSANQSWGAGKWAPSSISPLAVKIPSVMAGNIATVQISFVSTGNSTALTSLWGKFAGGAVGTVSIDSLMVDPYRRG
ncbi:MAG: hypothetical protein AAGC46_19345 [Solirubrobacteraceae bacterium]|nr:hypothetical protein [Patulibacter sp.]